MHYNRPFKDPLLQEYTYEELWEEFLTIQISRDPSLAISEGDDVYVQFKTGDKKVDKLEEKLAKGEDVDIFEALMDPEEARRLKEKFSAKKKGLEETKKLLEKEAPDLLDEGGFDDDFREPTKKPDDGPLKLG